MRPTSESRVEVQPLSVQTTKRLYSGLGRRTVLLTGLLVGILAGTVGWSMVNAAGKDEAPKKIHEELFLEYQIDATNPSVAWADITSAPDTFLLVRLQSQPETVYVTQAIQDDGGFPNPKRLIVDRAFLNGEKAYVYLMDDDSLSNSLWKELAQHAVTKGGAAVGHVTSVWTLGQIPGSQVIEFCNAAGERIGEMTLDGDDCIAHTSFRVKSKMLDFETDTHEAEALLLMDKKNLPAGSLKVFYGHRPDPSLIPPLQTKTVSENPATETN